MVDKNRGWLHHLETVYSLDPNFRMLVCVRELGQIYGSIEAQHQKTILLDFPDNLASLSPFDRADKLFNNSGVIGNPLHAMEVVQDLNSELQQRLYYVVFEHLMIEPVTVMKNIYEWLGLSPISFNPQQLPVKSSESDSHYHFKYLHRTYTQIKPPNSHVIPKRIQSELFKKYAWFYQTFYPGLLKPELTVRNL
ncbi:hypothetical protein GM3709_3779 (plasmid) [Geminocystis sp. NIES-3709]|nr:hypothetical protein GM3709_3779 [Geminocystis sp. NIES-3709]